MEFISASTIADVIDHIYKETFYSGYSFSFYKDYYKGEEIFQEFLLKICEEPDKKILDLYNSKQFNYYSAAIIRNLVANKYSKINKNYNNFKYNELNDCNLQEEVDDEICPYEVSNVIDDINNYLDSYAKRKKHGWSIVELFKMHFFEGISFREINKQTHIPTTSIFNCVNELRIEINKQFGQNYQEAKNILE